jgi:hypothetical protein
MSVMRKAARLWAPPVLLLAACGAVHAAEPEYQTVTLPGFTVEVLKGNLVKNVATATAGAYEVTYLPAGRRDKQASPADSVFRLNVSWIARTLPRGDWIRFVQPGIDSPGSFSGIELGRERDIGTDRWLGIRAQSAMELDRPYTAIGLVECNAGFSVTIAFTYHEDAAAQLAATERIVKSVKCDPATARLPIPEALLTLPASFKRVPDASVQRYAAADGSTVRVTFLPQDMLRRMGSLIPALQMQVTDHFDAQLAEDEFHGLPSSEPGLERLRNGLFAIDAGKLAGSFVRVRYCPGPQVTFFAFLRGPKGKPPTEETARELLDNLKCPGART